MSIYAHPISAIVWALSIALNFYTAWLALSSRSRKPQTFFGCLLAFISLENAALFGASAVRAGWAYFYIYWTSSALEVVGIAVQAYLCYGELFSPAPSMPRRFHYQFWSSLAVLTLAVLGAHFFFPEKGPVQDQFWFTALRTSSVWLCGVFWIISILSDVWHLRWHTRAYGIGLGFVVGLSSEAAMSILYASLSSHLRPLLYPAHCVGQLSASLVWLYYFRCKEAPVWSPEDSEIQQLRSHVCSSLLTAQHIAVDESKTGSILASKRKAKGPSND